MINLLCDLLLLRLAYEEQYQSIWSATQTERSAAFPEFRELLKQILVLVLSDAPMLALVDGLNIAPHYSLLTLR
jgi:hypothetical protein